MTHTLTELDQIVGGMTEQMNDKMDTDGRNGANTVDYVVEWQLPTAANNYTWYRKYKSGWVEQGGYGAAGTSYSGAVISLLVEMSDNTYSITLAVDNGENYNYPTTVRYSNRTTTSFNATGTYSGGYAAYRFTWEVKGMAAT